MPAQPDRDESANRGIRVQKLLASAGIDSRRKCEEYITAGRVTVDGEVVTDLGRRVDPAVHDVRLDGERLRQQKKRHYLLNKPAGYLCTNYDQAGRKLAVDLIPSAGTRLFSVGRLDEGSQGLLIVTNDGELAEQMAHPRYEVPRVYRVQVAGVPTPQTLAELRKGIHFTEGKFGLKRTKRLKTHGNSTFLEVELARGQNREIRRLFARVGHKVMWLQRIAFGPLKLGDLPVGHYRPLRAEEVRSLQQFAREAGRTAQRSPSRKPPRPATSTSRKAASPPGRRVLGMDTPLKPNTRTARPGRKESAGNRTSSAAKGRKRTRRESR